MNQKIIRPDSAEYKSAYKVWKEFKHWRDNKSKYPPGIPQKLLIAAAHLAIEISSINKVAKVLSLDYTKLKTIVNEVKELSITRETSSPDVYETTSDLSETKTSLRTDSVDSPKEIAGRNCSKSHAAVTDNFFLDGFIEVDSLKERSSKSCEPVAVIISPGGFKLKLYSENVNGIIKGFVNS